MSQAPASLEADAETFFRGVEGLTFPATLAGKYPHILNHIYAVRGDKEALRTYFQDLTEDHRGGRKGFDFDTLLDVQALRECLLGDVNGFTLDDTTKWVS